MFKPITTVIRAAAMAASLTIAPLAQAVTVNSDASSPVLIGAVVAGQTYSVVATGLADLFAGFNGGLGLTFTADGKPSYAFPAPYAPFVPNGLDYDPSVGTSSLGIGGAGKLLGALLGTFSAAPASTADYFTLGSSSTFTAASSGTLYAVVNDTYYPDNASSGYSVSLSVVPEPGTWLLLVAGLGSLAVRKSGSTRIRAAPVL
jgi:hypothetical protein